MPKEIATRSAETCKKVRMAYLYEIREMAELLGLEKHCVYQYEQGTRQPKLATVRKYIEVAEKKKIRLGIEDFIN